MAAGNSTIVAPGISPIITTAVIAVVVMVVICRGSSDETCGSDACDRQTGINGLHGPSVGIVGGHAAGADADGGGKDHSKCGPADF